MSEKKKTRVEALENLVNLIVRDMNQFQQHVNHLGRILQATVNVLGQGAVSVEVARLDREAAGGPPEAPPVSEEQKAATEEATGGDQAEDRPAEST